MTAPWRRVCICSTRDPLRAAALRVLQTCRHDVGTAAGDQLLTDRTPGNTCRSVSGSTIFFMFSLSSQRERTCELGTTLAPLINFLSVVVHWKWCNFRGVNFILKQKLTRCQRRVLDSSFILGNSVSCSLSVYLFGSVRVISGCTQPSAVLFSLCTPPFSTFNSICIWDSAIT
jgi:hypothetical protein